MTDFKSGQNDTASLRLTRLDNGFIRFAVCSEPGAAILAFVDLSATYTDDIVEIIKRLRSERLT